MSGVTMDRIGAYTWHPATDRWTWNDTMFQLLGYHPGQIHPSRALVVAHKHPADRAMVEHVMAEAAAHALPYAHRHRIVSITGEVLEVTAIGYLAEGGAARPGGVLFHGYLVHLATLTPLPPHRTVTSAGGGTPPTVPFEVPRVASFPWTLDPGREDDRILARAITVLAAAAELPEGAASHLLAHFANVAAVPLVVIAERLLAVDLDPDVRGLGDLLTGIAAEVPEPG